MREEKFQTTPPQYLQIAQDLATRISKGKLEEGSTLYGRSVMSSEYNVSPETIRRALRLLADMKVV
jgi:DNA-binding GntR family transcriptional regulator